MPQISLEYTANLAAEIDPALLHDVHRVLASVGGVAIAACKSRIHRIESYAVGEQEPAPGFVHLSVQIFPKSEAWKSEIGPLLLEALQKGFPDRGAAPVTVHIADSVDRAAYFRDPPMPPHPDDSVRQKVAAAFEVKARTGTNQAILDLLADDVRWTIAGSGALCRTYTSKADIVDNCLSLLGQRIDGTIKARVERIVADGDTVVVFWKGEGRTVWGDRYDNDYCWTFDFKNGVGVRLVAHIDTLLLDRVMAHPF